MSEPAITPDHGDGWYICTASGEHVSLECPRPSTINLSDITYALGNVRRFGGHVRHSVAAHSLFVAALARKGYGSYGAGAHDLRLHALLHDAHEAYMTDIPTPVAMVLGRERVTALKERLQAAIFVALAVRPPTPLVRDTVRRLDSVAMIVERHGMPRPDSGWGPSWPDVRVPEYAWDLWAEIRERCWECADGGGDALWWELDALLPEEG